MRNIFTRFMVVSLLLLVTATVSAQQTSLTAGKVYKFTNYLYGTKVLASNGVDDTRAADVVDGEKSQHWYCETETIDGTLYYKFRNLINGRYLAGNGSSSNWPMVAGDVETDTKYFLLETSGSYNVIRSKAHANDGFGYMHSNDSYNIVGWSTDGNGNATSWTISEVEYTADEINSILGEINTIENEVAAASTYQGYLDNIFADKACTVFKDGYTFSEDETNYKALPATLQNMVKKVSTDDWSEENADADKAAKNLNWGSEYGHKFRVQMYEPYSIAGDITNFLRMNAHANNDNPTGIYVHERTHVYVMVDGDIKDGASLRLIDAGSNERIGNATTGGFELKKGLNILPYFTAGGHLYVCYNVDTYNPNGTTIQDSFPHKISEYPPLKIHIEGGSINGFYNACGDFLAGKTYEGVTCEDLWKTITGASVDNDDDWSYMETRANLAVLPIISHRQILLFQLNEDNGKNGMSHFLPGDISVPETPYCYPQNGEQSSWDDYDAYGMDCNTSTGKINIWMETWDRIMHAELATLGLISESDVNVMNKFYPRWTNEGDRAEMYDMTNAGPDGKTYQQFCRGLDYSEYYNHHGVSLGTTSGYMAAGGDCAYYNNAYFYELMEMPTNGSTWGPVHEIGHQFQNVFNIRGATEVTNNVFSNAATWYLGISTSRYNGNDGTLSTTLNNFNSGLPFVDYNIWAMTQMFYKLWLYYHLAGNNTQFYPRFFEMLRMDPLNATGGSATGTESMLKIYEKMCYAAGEDLTEFFRAHGFFVLLDNYAKGDYGTTVFTQTQEEVNAAIARVKGKNYDPNYAVLLINDMETTATLSHDGVTRRNHYDGANAEKSEFGSVNDFISGETTVSQKYTATANSDGTITMSGGEGGVGFLVFDENGNVISFSDKSTFALSEEAAYLLVKGKANIVAVDDSESQLKAAEVDLTALQATLLSDLITTVEAMPIDDGSYTHIGYYTKDATANLSGALAAAKETKTTGVGLAAAYELLYNEYMALKEKDYADTTVPFDPSLTYILTNKAYPTRTLTIEEGIVCARTGVDTSTNAAKWQFKETNSGVYNVYNMSDVYCATISQSSKLSTTNAAGAATYTVNNLGSGLWAISLTPVADNTSFHSASNSNYDIVGWGAGADASKWRLTAVEPNKSTMSVAKLTAMIEKTEALTNKLGTFSITQGSEVSLQCDCEGEDYYILCNNPHLTGDDAAGGVAALLDENNSTYLHSNWDKDTKSTSNDYLQVNLGDGNGLATFMIAGVQRSVDNDRTKSIAIQGSYDNSVWSPVTTVTLDDSEQVKGAAWSSDGIISLPYPYLRFVITTTNTGTGRYYFHMAKFDLFNASLAATLNDEYSAYSATITNDLLCAAYEGAEMGKSWLNYSEATAQELDEYTATLEAKYTALYEAYKAVIDDAKDKLATLIASTNDLIAEVGEATVVAPIVVDLHGKLYAESPYTAGGKTHSDYSSQDNDYNLLDGNKSTFFHSDYNFSTMPTNPYIQVDLGEGQTAKEFNFGYTTRAATGCAPKTIKVYGGNLVDGNIEYSVSPLATYTSGDSENPLPLTASTDWETKNPVESATAYRYFKFLVTDSEGSPSSGGVTKYYFVMSEFNFDLPGIEEATVKVEYEGLVSTDLLVETRRVVNASDVMVGYAEDYVATVEQIEAQYNALQAAYNALEAAKNNVAAAKEDLKKLIDNTQALYDKMAAGDGSVNDDYITSTLTDENLSETLAKITVATEVYDDPSAIAGDIKTAYDELNEKYTLLKGIKELDVAKDDLNTLIAAMEGLLEQTTTGVTEIGSVPLQIDDESAPYYIWSNSPASDCNDYDNRVQGLIDVNADGSANTGTFFGTSWSSHVDAYTHYIEIDLGVDNVVLEGLSIDYTTRESGAADSRPNGLKFYGSSDKNTYEVFHSVTEGLPADANTKWSMETPIELAKSYRYIRIAVSSPHGSCFNMSDFNLYSHCVATVNQSYATATVFNCMPAALREYCDAREAAGAYLVAADYETAYNELQAAYDALNAASVADKTELNNLIEATRILKNGLYETVIASYTANEITLSTNENEAGYLYCNAPETNSSWTTDNAGVAAAIDLTTEGEPNLDTFLHTEYGSDQSVDGLDHYLRVDLGTDGATDYIEFGYYGRSGHEAKSPKKVIVAATNDLTDGGVWTEIATLNPAQASASTETKTGCLGNGVEYRYWRFLVEETHGGGKDGNNHQFFCMTEFNVYKCTEIVKDEQLKYTPTIYIYTAADLVTEVENAITTATGVSEDENATPAGVETAVDALQAVYDKLEEALKYAGLPVTITTDEENPVLYNIISKRGDSDKRKMLQFDEPASDKVALVATADNASYQAWYFMKGENGYLIKPFNGDGKMLGVSSTGNAKASASIAETPTYKEWDFSRSTVTGCTDYFYIYVNGTSHACLSHNGGFAETDKLGIWSNGWNTDDGGSLFKFVEATFENNNARFYQLSDFENTLEYQTATTPEGTTVGAFVNGDAYSTAYSAASTLITAGNTSDATACKDAYTALRTASVGVEKIVPEEGKIYRIYITPGLTDDRAGASMCIGDNGKLAWGIFDKENPDSHYYFTFEYDDDSNLYMKSLHSSTYLDEALDNSSNKAVGADANDIGEAKNIAINTLGKSGDAVVVGIVPNGGAMLNCKAEDKEVVAYNNTAVDKASAWVIEEVSEESEEIANIGQSITLNTAAGEDKSYSTLYSAYPVTLPDGVDASIITERADNGLLTMQTITSESNRVVPAKTAVILSQSKSDASSADFVESKVTFSTQETATVVAEGENMLNGTLFTEYIACGVDCADYRVYTLGRKNDKVAMYWAYANYQKNEDGTFTKVDGDNGGYVKMGANKAYLKIGTNGDGASAIAMFSFWFGGETTGIGGVDADTVADGIYDLQGRKIEEVTAPGFYIVNGKKVYISDVE